MGLTYKYIKTKERNNFRGKIYQSSNLPILNRQETREEGWLTA